MKAREVGLAVGVMSASAALVGLGSRLRHAHGDGAATAGGAAVLAEGRIALSAMIALVDSKLTSAATALVVIASTAEAQSGDWERIEPLLSRLAEGYPQAVLGFAQPDGRYHTVNTGLQPIDVTDRHYFQEAMAGRRTMADLILDRAAGKPSVIVAVPVKAGPKIVGVMGVSLLLKPLSRWLMQSLRFPENMVFGVLDAEGKIALDQDPETIFRDTAALGSPSLTRVVDETRAGREGTGTYELNGRARRVVYATSPLTGWHYALGVIVQ